MRHIQDCFPDYLRLPLMAYMSAPSDSEFDQDGPPKPPKLSLPEGIKFITAYASHWRQSCGVVQCELMPAGDDQATCPPLSVVGQHKALDVDMTEHELIHAIVLVMPQAGAVRLLSAMRAHDTPSIDEPAPRNEIISAVKPVTKPAAKLVARQGRWPCRAVRGALRRGGRYLQCRH
jgi:hypothetical protein